MISAIYIQSGLTIITHHRDIEGTGHTGKDVLGDGSVSSKEVCDLFGWEEFSDKGCDVWLSDFDYTIRRTLCERVGICVGRGRVDLAQTVDPVINSCLGQMAHFLTSSRTLSTSLFAPIRRPAVYKNQRHRLNNASGDSPRHRPFERQSPRADSNR